MHSVHVPSPTNSMARDEVELRFTAADAATDAAECTAAAAELANAAIAIALASQLQPLSQLPPPTDATMVGDQPALGKHERQEEDVTSSKRAANPLLALLPPGLGMARPPPHCHCRRHCRR